MFINCKHVANLGSVKSCFFLLWLSFSAHENLKSVVISKIISINIINKKIKTKKILLFFFNNFLKNL